MTYLQRLNKILPMNLLGALVILSLLTLLLRPQKEVAIPIIEVPVIKVEQLHLTEFVATGYAIGYPYNNIAKSGVPAVNLGFIRVDGINFFTAAVDPSVIPLGSLIYIRGIGVAWASDTGPAIKGLRLDICFKTMEQAMKFGKRKVQVMLLDKSATDEEILNGTYNSK